MYRASVRSLRDGMGRQTWVCRPSVHCRRPMCAVHPCMAVKTGMSVPSEVAAPMPEAQRGEHQQEGRDGCGEQEDQIMPLEQDRWIHLFCLHRQKMRAVTYF